MQEIVKERLPKFSDEEVALVKGSVDFVGINQYTTFYMFNPTWPKPKTPGYQSDWNVGYACKNHILTSNLSLIFDNLVSYCVKCCSSTVEKNGKPIGPRVTHLETLLNVYLRNLDSELRWLYLYMS